MKNNFDELFDKNARDLFQDFKMDFDPAADWGKMEQQLNHRADEKFDQQAKNTFEGFEMEFNPTDWERMERLLDKKRHRPTYFWLYKTLQLGLMSTVAAAAFWFFAFDFNQNPAKQGQTTDGNNPANNEGTKQLQVPNQNPVSANQNGQTALHLPATKQQNGDNAAVSAYSNPKTSQATAKNGEKSLALQQLLATQKDPAKLLDANQNGNQGKNTAKNGEKSLTFQQLLDMKRDPAKLSDANQNEQGGTQIDNSQTLQLMPILSLSGLESQDMKVKSTDTDPQVGFGLKKIKLKQPYMRQLKLALVSSIETHSENSQGRGSSSFMLGAQVEGDLNRYFAIAAGLQYARRNHELEQISSVASPDGLLYTQKERRLTHLSIVQIPILLQTSVLRNEKWRVYLNTGLNANLIFDKTYSGELQISAPQSAGNARIQTNISSREYEGGYLQTGNFRPNAFLTLQAGLGVERQLSDRWSLYVQPNYQQSINKFGNQLTDKSRIISLNVGVKTSF